MSGPTNDELLQSIVQAPDDAARWVLYSDWLQERGDPRGELIAIDMALEEASASQRETLTSSREAFIRANAFTLLGQVFGSAVREGYVLIGWRRGFVDAVSFVGIGLAHQRAVGWLIDTMCRTPEPFVFLRELTLTQTDLADLAPLKIFARLEELRVGSTRVTDIRPLDAMARLKLVDLRGCEVAQDPRKQLQERGVRVL